jgi:hypothetical protein
MDSTFTFRTKRDPTSVVEEALDKGMTMYPNPADEQMTINLQDGLQIDSGVHLRIFNSLCIEMKFKPSEGCQPSEGSRINISTEEFPSGVYYCSFNSGMNRITKSFVVVR